MQTKGLGSQGGLSGWSTREVVVAAVVAAILGLLFMAYSVLWMALSPLLGTVPVMILYGFYFSAGILVPYIIRKPGAAIAGETIAAIVEVLAGSPFGVAAILAGFVQGLGAEIGFAVGGWRKYNIAIMGLSGALAAIFAYGNDFVMLGYSQLTTDLQIGIFVVMLISGVVLGGGLSKAIGDALAATGVLSSFAIGRDKTKFV
jgi:energy-coupling factor transport system permease protein